MDERTTIDAGWGALALARDPYSRVTAEQAAALQTFGPTAEVGTCEVRFGDEFGNLLVVEENRFYEVRQDGSYEEVVL